MNNNFCAGYASVNINPPLGIGMLAYYVPRYAKGFLDDLTASALALSKNGKTFLILSVDNCSIRTEMVKRCTARIEKDIGIPASNI